MPCFRRVLRLSIGQLCTCSIFVALYAAVRGLGQTHHGFGVACVIMYLYMYDIICMFVSYSTRYDNSSIAITTLKVSSAPWYEYAYICICTWLRNTAPKRRWTNLMNERGSYDSDRSTTTAAVVAALARKRARNSRLVRTCSSLVPVLAPPEWRRL